MQLIPFFSQILEYNNSYNNEITEEKEIFSEIYTKDNKEELEDTETIEMKEYNIMVVNVTKLLKFHIK